MSGHKHSPDKQCLQRRRNVRSVACPKCGAVPGKKCRSLVHPEYIRAASHAERWEAFQLSKQKGEA